MECKCKRHGRESLTSVVAWSAYPTRSASPASITTKLQIDNDNEFDESTPLLATHDKSGRPKYPNYGLESEQTLYRQYERRELKFLTQNNHDRLNEKNKYSSSTYYAKTQSHLCSLRLFCMLFILASGLIVATYLMIAESRLPTLSFALELVNHDIWSKMQIPIESLLNSTSFLNVLLLHTGGMSCSNPVNCIEILKQMQIEQSSNTTEMSYNFLVADDGQTYEVRGWDHISGYSSLPQQDTSLIIGFIGNYTFNAPNAVLLQSALSLIKESVRRNKLLRNYQIYGIRNITVADNDAEALFKYIVNWPHFERLLEVN